MKVNAHNLSIASAPPRLTPSQQRLAERLNAIQKPPFGIIWDHDYWENVIAEKGRTFETTDVRFVEARASRCHYNTALLFWLHYPKYQIATGFGYSAPGKWARHSWLVEGETIIETTTSRDLYFGVVMEDLNRTNFFINEMMHVLEDCGLNVRTDGKRYIISE